MSDSERLLTDEDLVDICRKLAEAARTDEQHVEGIDEATWALVRLILKAQDVKTARLVREQTAREIFEELGVQMAIWTNSQNHITSVIDNDALEALKARYGVGK